MTTVSNDDCAVQVVSIFDLVMMEGVFVQGDLLEAVAEAVPFIFPDELEPGVRYDVSTLLGSGLFDSGRLPRFLVKGQVSRATVRDGGVFWHEDLKCYRWFSGNTLDDAYGKVGEWRSLMGGYIAESGVA